jgi:hypothetical protein
VSPFLHSDSEASIEAGAREGSDIGCASSLRMTRFSVRFRCWICAAFRGENLSCRGRRRGCPRVSIPSVRVCAVVSYMALPSRRDWSLCLSKAVRSVFTCIPYPTHVVWLSASRCARHPPKSHFAPSNFEGGRGG